MRVMIGSEGINNQPESWKDFLNPFIAIVNQRDDWRMQGVFYDTNAVTVEANEGERVQTFANIVKAYDGREIHAMGHSNGSRVVLDGWKLCDAIASRRPKLTTVHLLCGACDSDCDANGINAGILGGTIGDVFIYVAGKDSAMRLEDTLLGKALFELPEGHVPLGLDGPTNVNPLCVSHIHVIDWEDYDHSTCWEPNFFNMTVLQVMTLAETRSGRATTSVGSRSPSPSAAAPLAAVSQRTEPLLTPKEQGLAEK